MTCIVALPMQFWRWHFAQAFTYRTFTNMNKVLTIVLSSLVAANLMFSQVASAASDCEAKAVSKAGK